jgi:hypothetical protein
MTSRSKGKAKQTAVSFPTRAMPALVPLGPNPANDETRLEITHRTKSVAKAQDRGNHRQQGLELAQVRKLWKEDEANSSEQQQAWMAECKRRTEQEEIRHRTIDGWN